MSTGHNIKRSIFNVTWCSAVLPDTVTLSTQDASVEESAAEPGRELSNPTAALGSMTSNIDFRTFHGNPPSGSEPGLMRFKSKDSRNQDSHIEIGEE